MSVDEFGLGGWWPRPEQAAAGALDRLPSGEWPMLAAMWLAAGFDSPQLRQLAAVPAARRGGGPSRHDGLGTGAGRTGIWLAGPSDSARVADQFKLAFQIQDLMPEVLRSIGFDPAPADEAFLARCEHAVDIVQRDLDATGHGQYRMRARFGRGWPAMVYPAMPDGSYWGGSEGMPRGEDGAGLLAIAAQLVSDTLKEIPEVEWPVCAIHGGHPGSIWSGEDSVELIQNVAWWRCTNTGHRLTPVGQLTADAARTL
jgi:hypothetical protein